MARHVVRPFRCVRKIVGFLWDQTFKKCFEISPRRRIGVLKNDQARARMLDEYGRQPAADLALPDNLLNPLRYFIGPLAVRPDLEFRIISTRHRNA